MGMYNIIAVLFILLMAVALFASGCTGLTDEQLVDQVESPAIATPPPPLVRPYTPAYVLHRVRQHLHSDYFLSCPTAQFISGVMWDPERRKVLVTFVEHTEENENLFRETIIDSVYLVFGQANFLEPAV